MRAYGKVAPAFWTGTTGRHLRGAGPAVQVVALYLLTGPHANMLGLYYLPLPFICHETGLPEATVREAFQALQAAGFCRHDPATEVVWVVEMARFQVAERLAPADKRVQGIRRALERLPENPFAADFLARYRDAFHLGDGPAREGAR